MESTINPTPPEAPAADAPESPLSAYLASHDAPCPHCRYNLRGVTTGMCPECGREVRLSLETPRRLGGRGPLILALLLVVLVGGAVSGVRQWASVRAAAGTGVFTLTTGTPLRVTSTNGAVTIFSPTPSTPAGGGGSISVTTPGLTFSGTPGSGGTVSRLLTTRVGGPGGFVATPAPANWGAVPVRSWTILGIWSGLAAGALAGLIVLLVLRLRRRPPGPGWARTLSGAAVALAAAFGAAHVTLLVVDVL